MNEIETKIFQTKYKGMKTFRAHRIVAVNYDSLFRKNYVLKMYATYIFNSLNSYLCIFMAPN